MNEEEGAELKRREDVNASERPGSQVRFLLLFGLAMLCPSAMAPQAAISIPEDHTVMRQPAIDADGTACARCHQKVVDDFAANPHSKSTQTPDSDGVTCKSCHGPGKAHEQNGDVASIFNPATAIAKDVNEKCQACHGGAHESEEPSHHSNREVSCVDCHRVHLVGAQAHNLRQAQPELCYRCHKEIEQEFNLRSRHKVAEGLIQCTDCHDAHDTDREKGRHTAEWQLDVCGKCHTAVGGPFVYEHAVVKSEGCTACHYPHGGADAKLLIRSNVNAICQECHAPSLNFPMGQPAVPEHMQSPQAPLCSGCHSGLHGSNVSSSFLSPTIRILSRQE